MNTAKAIDLFLESRRSKRLSKVTIDTYGWALGKMSEMFPGELPGEYFRHSATVHRKLRPVGIFAADYLEQASHILVVGGERGFLLQCYGGCSSPGDEAQAASHTPT